MDFKEVDINIEEWEEDSL
ncbi:hypothetical protein StPhP954_gp03 [Staphylococcus phage P954]|uniref:Uncharacterized protein n=1 Tax=Staphylococcus phage P954 TaxID=668618 RepID=C8CGX4_9CAUD|nr:hypothetical protein StPhP954_gp03 [Staphylococcus phage P954]ACV04944.1 hypothetical protein [Staphylococcus phage P954]